MVNAWSRIAVEISKLFPNKLLALDILERNDFPPISDDGTATRNSPVKERIINFGLTNFAGRFAVQWNGLSVGGQLAPTVLTSGKRGAVIGWQSNAFRGLEGAGCNSQRLANADPCDNSGFSALLKHGIDSGGAYIEVWSKDVIQFPSVVKAADQDLRARFDRGK